MGVWEAFTQMYVGSTETMSIVTCDLTMSPFLNTLKHPEMKNLGTSVTTGVQKSKIWNNQTLIERERERERERENYH
jgi:hypothetical protein